MIKYEINVVHSKWRDSTDPKKEIKLNVIDNCYQQQPRVLLNMLWEERDFDMFIVCEHSKICLTILNYVELLVKFTNVVYIDH